MTQFRIIHELPSNPAIRGRGAFDAANLLETVASGAIDLAQMFQFAVNYVGEGLRIQHRVQSLR